MRTPTLLPNYSVAAAGSVICTLWIVCRLSGFGRCAGLVRDVRREPSSTDDLTGLEALVYWTHLCDRVRSRIGYLCRMNTCLVDSDVSLNPLGLLWINIHLCQADSERGIEYQLITYTRVVSHLARSDTPNITWVVPGLQWHLNIVVTPWVHPPTNRKAPHAWTVVSWAPQVLSACAPGVEKVAVSSKLWLPKIRKNHRFMRMRTRT